MSEKRDLDSEDELSEPKKIKLEEEDDGEYEGNDDITLDSETENDHAKDAFEVALREESVEVCVNEGSHTTEKDVGITQYVSEHKGFVGVVKQRYSDFHVWERDLKGEVVHLNDLNPPEHPKNREPVDMSILNTLPQNLQSKLWMMTEDGSSVTSVKIPIAGRDKEERRMLHFAFRALHPHIKSQTKSRTDGKEATEILVFKHHNDRHPDNRNWPEGKPDYIYFALYKENLDTMDAISQLAHRLRISPRSFNYAGVKDKRAKTTQLVSIRRVAPERLIKASSGMSSVMMGNFSYKKRALDLGDLTGNRFAMVLRSVEAPQHIVNTALSNVQQHGFINYFGLQRFGTTTIPTHHVGRAMLQRQWKKAVELIMTPRINDSSGINKVREYWWEHRDHKTAAKIARQKKAAFTIEGRLLHCLHKSKGDYHNALLMLPRNLRLIYIHAYQSYIFNSVVDRRIIQHGLKVLAGDLKLTKKSDPRAKTHLSTKMVSVSEVESTPIYDVVIPLPGFDVNYPNNEIRDWILELLHQDKLELFTFKKISKSYGLPGSYRKMVVKPEDMSWKFVKYKDYEVPLVLSDKDILREKTYPEQPEDSPNTAVVVEFTLPPSCYATMVLREALKIDTSAKAMENLQTQIAAKNSHEEKTVEEENTTVEEENITVQENKTVKEEKKTAEEENITAKEENTVEEQNEIVKEENKTVEEVSKSGEGETIMEENNIQDT